jgi:hypothetical protein
MLVKKKNPSTKQENHGYLLFVQVMTRCFCYCLYKMGINLDFDQLWAIKRLAK